ncbi:MAG: AAA family ATPase [Holosporales bacterium]|jgi:ATP-dependent exoDNAse (exonuclease V) alpha subunit|nr:AAA family ATPase [Holosporales bacterium]
MSNIKYYIILFLYTVFNVSCLENHSVISKKLNSTEIVFTNADVFRNFNKLNTKNALEYTILEKSQKYLGSNIKKHNIYIGSKYRKLEASVLGKFEKISKKSAKVVCSSETISKILKKYSFMSKEQKDSVVQICGERNVNILIGKAGSGKTTALKAIAETYRESGAQVIGMSLSALASENLEKYAKIESHSIAYWFHKKWKPSKSQLKQGDVIVVDEAGMVGTSEWKKILNAVVKFELKLIIVGDYNQFQPISIGDCFKSFMDITNNLYKNNSIFELKEIRRQKKKWMQEASVDFSNLKISQALERYEKNKKILALGKAEKDAENIVAKKYLELEKLGGVVVLCYSKLECRAVNNAIRNAKKEKGELGEDVVIVNDRPFAIGEKIMLLHNESVFKIKNGQTAIFKSYNDGIIHLETENGTIKRIDIEVYDQIDYGYAITLHKSQGKSFKNVLVVASKMMDARALYVAMTRHTDDIYLYYKRSDFGSFQDLIEHVSKYNYYKGFESLEDKVS